MGWRDVQVDGAHYKALSIQPTDYIVKNKLGWREGNIVKYITRHSEKGKAKDVRKIIHFALMILEDEYGEEYEIRSVD